MSSPEQLAGAASDETVNAFVNLVAEKAGGRFSLKRYSSADYAVIDHVGDRKVLHTSVNRRGFVFNRKVHRVLTTFRDREPDPQFLQEAVEPHEYFPFTTQITVFRPKSGQEIRTMRTAVATREPGSNVNPEIPRDTASVDGVFDGIAEIILGVRLPTEDALQGQIDLLRVQGIRGNKIVYISSTDKEEEGLTKAEIRTRRRQQRRTPRQR